MKLIRYECDVCKQEMKGDPLILSYSLTGKSRGAYSGSQQDICSFKCARLALIAFTNSLREDT